MQKHISFTGALCLLLSLMLQAQAPESSPVNLYVASSFQLPSKVGSLRAVPVQYDKDKTGILTFYSADKEIDPFIEMFYPPTDNPKMVLYSLDGEIIWKKELGMGVLNGIWFTPVYPFDLDKDGIDEIYFVNNTDDIHLLSYNSRRLEALDAKTGKSIGHWPWKRSVKNETLSHTFRNFIIGGYVKGEPVLLTAQGTYGRMGIQAWNKGMDQRWDLIIEADEPGPRGSHMCPVVDIDNNDIDELFWGERCVSLDNGQYLFVADEDVYNGHSDVVQPTLNRKNNKWYIFTCRESGDRGQIKPRVVMFDDKGERVWTDLEEGHMDMGWTAHTGKNGETTAFTISRGGKKAGPDGFIRLDVKEFTYSAYSGEKIALPFNAYNTIPVDLNGDGVHELACALGEQADQNIYNIEGEVLGNLGKGAYVAMASKFLDLPGEQILCYYPDGTLKIWADKNAIDSEQAKKRYSHPYYISAQRLTATGYNLVNLGGL